MKPIGAFFLSLGVVILGVEIVSSATAQNQKNSLSGEVERVWEDGFQLQDSDRTIRIDSWDVCGDNTSSNIEMGDRVTVTGEFERGEFDAFSIVKADGTNVCS